MEYFGHLNLLKTGIVFAEMVTTVSPSYASEIQTPEYGCGLHGVLQNRGDDLVGILNGVDTEIWNPEIDQSLPRNYCSKTVTEGKAACKAELQKQVGLPVRDDVPLFGMISRMTHQKGFDLICESAEELLAGDVQFNFLGTGDSDVENYVTDLSRRFPDKVATTIGFDDELAHRIEAGSDAFLMPSRFEPCGLNQMYSLIYGTLPVVRSVGGLADSVVNATDENIAERTATGFRFDDYHREAFAGQVSRAAKMFHDKPVWKQIAQTGMRQDWSWKRSAGEYMHVYERAKEKIA
jgi:starch synthase